MSGVYCLYTIAVILCNYQFFTGLFGTRPNSLFNKVITIWPPRKGSQLIPSIGIFGHCLDKISPQAKFLVDLNSIETKIPWKLFKTDKQTSCLSVSRVNCTCCEAQGKGHMYAISQYKNMISYFNPCSRWQNNNLSRDTLPQWGSGYRPRRVYLVWWGSGWVV